ncbi:hypothetical protein DYBT9275_04112 [Dyadobacter sp. CECT 9275]|uniref:Uncharacterized protein n=1 Tax=Dyadobacter helix TaxID=2822344 RepID=A0A916JG44_9BACT|nr:hypothetical protein DYBT9275_04112 [Dyadobacter sp. CECT 9275]
MPEYAVTAAVPHYQVYGYEKLFYRNNHKMHDPVFIHSIKVKIEIILYAKKLNEPGNIPSEPGNENICCS